VKNIVEQKIGYLNVYYSNISELNTSGCLKNCKSEVCKCMEEAECAVHATTDD